MNRVADAVATISHPGYPDLLVPNAGQDRE